MFRTEPRNDASAKTIYKCKKILYNPIHTYIGIEPRKYQGENQSLTPFNHKDDGKQVINKNQEKLFSFSFLPFLFLKGN